MKNIQKDTSCGKSSLVLIFPYCMWRVFIFIFMRRRENVTPFSLPLEIVVIGIGFLKDYFHRHKFIIFIVLEICSKKQQNITTLHLNIMFNLCLVIKTLIKSFMSMFMELGYVCLHILKKCLAKFQD